MSKYKVKLSRVVTQDIELTVEASTLEHAIGCAWSDATSIDSNNFRITKQNVDKVYSNNVDGKQIAHKEA